MIQEDIDVLVAYLRQLLYILFKGYYPSKPDRQWFVNISGNAVFPERLKRNSGSVIEWYEETLQDAIMNG